MARFDVWQLNLTTRPNPPSHEPRARPAPLPGSPPQLAGFINLMAIYQLLTFYTIMYYAELNSKVGSE